MELAGRKRIFIGDDTRKAVESRKKSDQFRMTREMNCFNAFAQERQKTDELKIIAKTLLAMKHESFVFQTATVPALALGVPVRHAILAGQPPFIFRPSLLVIPVEQEEQREAEMRFAVVGIGLDGLTGIARSLRGLVQTETHQSQRSQHGR